MVTQYTLDTYSIPYTVYLDLPCLFSPKIKVNSLILCKKCVLSQLISHLVFI